MKYWTYTFETEFSAEERMQEGREPFLTSMYYKLNELCAEGFSFGQHVFTPTKDITHFLSTYLVGDVIVENSVNAFSYRTKIARRDGMNEDLDNLIGRYVTFYRKDPNIERK